MIKREGIDLLLGGLDFFWIEAGGLEMSPDILLNGNEVRIGSQKDNMHALLFEEGSRLLRAVISSSIKDIPDAVVLIGMISLHLLMNVSHEELEDMRIRITLYTCIVDISFRINSTNEVDLGSQLFHRNAIRIIPLAPLSSGVAHVCQPAFINRDEDSVFCHLF